MSQPVEFKFPPEPKYLRNLRERLRDKLAGLGVAEDTVDNVLLVTDEIVSNAIEHSDGYRAAEVKLIVRLGARGHDILLEFEDPDVPADVVEEIAEALANRGERPPLHSERGRGLFLIAQNVDRLEVSARPDGGLRLQGRFQGALA